MCCSCFTPGVDYFNNNSYLIICRLLLKYVAAKIILISDTDFGHRFIWICWNVFNR